MSGLLAFRPARLAAIAILAVAAVAAAVVAGRLAPAGPQGAATSITPPLSAELARCRTLGIAAQDDAACRDAWRASRRQFLGQSPEAGS